MRCSASAKSVRRVPEAHGPQHGVYSDGYANTGQDDGTTLWNWWPKAKAGAIFAGHDYHPQWPETMAAVDSFCRKVDRPITVIEGCKDTKGEDRFDSWSIIK